MQLVKNVLVTSSVSSPLGFFYCFYESFIHKIILVIQLLPLICISYPLKVFKFVIGIFRNSCAVPLLETLNRLP